MGDLKRRGTHSFFEERFLGGENSNFYHAYQHDFESQFLCIKKVCSSLKSLYTNPPNISLTHPSSINPSHPFLTYLIIPSESTIIILSDNILPDPLVPVFRNTSFELKRTNVEIVEGVRIREREFFYI